MDGLGDKVLTGAAFALNQNRRGFAGCNLFDEVHQFRHLGRNAHHVAIAGSASHLASQGLDFGAQAGGFKSVLDGNVQLIEIHRLAHEVVGPELERGLDVVELRIGGDHDDGAGVAILPELIEHFDAGEVRHADVEQDQIGRFMLGEFERRFSGVGLDHVVAPLLTLLAERPAYQALVVHDHDLLCSHRCLIYYE